jgi:hypothetical protein
MVKVRLGGWLFRVKNRWEEVTPSEAMELFKAEGIREHISILTTPRIPPQLKISEGHLLALYELITFTLEVPEVVSNEVEVPPARGWAFKDFELCRQAITKHPEALPLTFARITQILDLPEENYLEVGAKALDEINSVMEVWRPWGIFDSAEPTAEEVNAGIERLQAFGVYSIVSRLAEHFGKLPEEIEKRTVNAVFLDWVMLVETAKYGDRLREQKG